MKEYRVVLAPLREADSPILFQWINDRDLVVFNAPFRPVSEAEHAGWFRSIRNRKDIAIFGIRDARTDELVGSCQLKGIDPVSRSAELQIRIGSPRHRDKGLGTEAVELLLEHGFRVLGLNRIMLHVFETNPRARHVYEKMGFKKEGLLRQAVFIEGKFVDIVVMGLLRAEYDKA